MLSSLDWLYPAVTTAEPEQVGGHKWTGGEEREERKNRERKDIGQVFDNTLPRETGYVRSRIE